MIGANEKNNFDRFATMEEWITSKKNIKQLYVWVCGNIGNEKKPTEKESKER